MLKMCPKSKTYNHSNEIKIRTQCIWLELKLSWCTEWQETVDGLQLFVLKTLKLSKTKHSSTWFEFFPPLCNSDIHFTLQYITKMQLAVFKANIVYQIEPPESVWIIDMQRQSGDYLIARLGLNVYLHTYASNNQQERRVMCFGI
jgi:hypothetical protein